MLSTPSPGGLGLMDDDKGALQSLGTAFAKFDGVLSQPGR